MIKKLSIAAIALVFAATGMSAAEEASSKKAVMTCQEAAARGAELFKDDDEISLKMAVELFAEVLSRSSDCVPALVGHARAVNRIKGFAITPAEYYRAFEYLARAFVIEPDNAQAWWVMADLQRHVGRYDRAILLAKKAADMAPEDEWANYVLGSTLMMSDMNEAITYLEKALKLKPGWEMVTLNLSAAYISAGKFKEALVLINSYLAAHASDINALTNRGVIYIKLGNIDEAEADFEKVLELNPRFGLALKGRGDVHFARKDYLKAVEAYRLALLELPNDISLWLLLVETQEKAGLIDEAIKSCQRVVELDPDDEKKKATLEELKVKKSDKNKP